MITDIFKKFNENKLTEKIIIINTLTSFSVYLYPYLLMLKETLKDQNNNRTEEYELVKKYREIFFNLRDLYYKDEITKEKIASDINDFSNMFKTHLILLKANKERSWECEMFQGFYNDILDFKYLMNPNKE